jgi:hypothetical protein
MIHAASTHNNLHSLWLEVLYSNTFPSHTDVHIIIIIIIIIIIHTELPNVNNLI